VAILGGVLAKLGTYGLYDSGAVSGNLGGCSARVSDLGAISAVYGALTAIAQKISSMVAYSSIGHMGYVLLSCRRYAG